MKQVTRGPMSATPWLLLLCLAGAAGGGVLHARAQPDSKGFITIDCGLEGETGFVDNFSTLAFVPDNGEFTDDAGTCHNISAENITPSLGSTWYTVRSFATGARNCYTLRSLVPGLKYLVRARFMYGNYDGLNRLPVFDLHIGVNYWHTVNISSPEAAKNVEAIVVVPDDFVQVCLINTGAGTPFISGLDLRPLKNTIYPQATKAQGLVLLTRFNFGPTDKYDVIRYPDDPHDRFWFPWVNSVLWREMSTTRKVHNMNPDLFEAPPAVLRTAISPRNNIQIQFSWEPQPQPNDPSPAYFIIMHFTELQLLPANATREFYINLNGDLWDRDAVTPAYLYSGVYYNTFASRKSQYNITINATANSTLPPIINAVEVFSVIPTTNIATDSEDVAAIMAIKAKYQVRRNWMGDPCGPGTVMVWDTLTCNYTIAGPPRIRRVDLSSSGLNGDISSYFADLKAVQYLNLSTNNLVGSIPDSLSQLSSLTVLDLSGNQLSGSIPSGLLRRIQDGSLNLRYDNNRDICTNKNSCKPIKTKSRLAMYIAIPAVLIVLIVVVALLFRFIRRKKQGSLNSSVKPQKNKMTSYAPGNNVYTDNSLQLENRRFTYEELEMITNNFEKVLGQGGFAKVYNGFLEDGSQVAVKLLSNSSIEGVSEFLAEAQILTRIHHKNLVSLIGYCKDGDCMALVYEYMSEGTLQEHIEGRKYHGGCLPWKQRLQIALESAHGLEYLHKGCNPPLIHRDVKATNILLNTMMEAKISDFGLSKAFKGGSQHVSTEKVVGTPGYVDPEYHATMQLTAKSDVYSFGVVLLELVTGKPAILREPEAAPIGIIQWTRQRMARGNIESVVDARMGGIYDVNSVWKVVEIALKCSAYASIQRPTMTNVVVQLQECIELEEGPADEDANSSFYTGDSSDNPNLSYDDYVSDLSTNMSQSKISFPMKHDDKGVAAMPTGPTAR
ncbi:putative leucine-rich repeat receptor-like protein kinase At2g19210 [Lolium rigidum]|uniref:putative leucine-rich repeat receptor-like protein kinase At2g19210 n=1 Tax=Lolium rigidum TaxID=89674 RepID=UPI001F5D8EDC|nr:putative leucine-rich repeat receptor-like protein kinase At2g19210 [Lolium rigidum]